MSKLEKGERLLTSASTDFYIQYDMSRACVIDIPLQIDECYIYKVPENLRNLNKELYTPQLISIGPLHQGNTNLAGMEKHKVKYLREFCKRTTEVKLKNLIQLWEPDSALKATCKLDYYEILYGKTIRRRYAEESTFRQGYMKTILLDAVFIIELFLRDFQKKKEKEKELYEDDYLLKNQWLKNSIQQDLLLLENQLPYFFLKESYTLAFPNNHQLTFDDLTLEYFKEYNRQKLSPKKILHFTDLLRYFMFDNSQVVPKKTSKTKIQFNAVKLHDAGVEFKVSEDGFLNGIRFDEGNGTLTMPRFEVDNTTERVFRNLMAYEQWHYSSEAYISYYIFFMDCLIDTAKDVELLIEKEIIVNWLGSNEEVAKLVNNLHRNITTYNSCYHHVCEKLNSYTKSFRHRTMAKLLGVYFSDVWRGTATVAAVILVGLTFLQTISSYLALR